jgi:large subunit ribosomal protein L5
MSAAKTNPMSQPQIEKVTVNIGVGEAGERLKKAESVLENITNQKPIQTISTITNKEFGIRKRMPIGCKVTLRGTDAHDFLKKAWATRENRIADYAFDEQGNLSFGIPDHTLFKNQKYNPDIGIFGMDISITMEKPGYRIKRRRIQKRKVPHKHHVSKEEAMDYISNTFDVKVIE